MNSMNSRTMVRESFKKCSQTFVRSDMLNKSRKRTGGYIINIQPDGKNAKKYQVKQIRQIVEKYKLGGDSDEE